MNRRRIFTGITLLIVGFIFVAIIMAAVAGIGYINMKSYIDNMTSMYYDHTVPIEELWAAQAALYKIANEVNSAIIFPANRATVEIDIHKSIDVVEKGMSSYRSGLLVREEKNELVKFDLAWKTYQKIIDGVVENIKSGNIDKAKTTISDSNTVTSFSSAADALNGLIKINREIANELNKKGDATFSSSVFTMIIITVTGLILVMGLFISMGICILRDKKVSSPLEK